MSGFVCWDISDPEACVRIGVPKELRRATDPIADVFDTARILAAFGFQIVCGWEGSKKARFSGPDAVTRAAAHADELRAEGHPEHDDPDAITITAFDKPSLSFRLQDPRADELRLELEGAREKIRELEGRSSL